MLLSWLTGAILVFARVGSALAFMPGFGEAFIPVRVRLMIALTVSLAIYPASPLGLLEIPSLPRFAAILILEVTIGIWIAMMARAIMAALHFAGYQIGMISGLSNALAPDGASFQGGTIFASALLLAGIAAIFGSDFHHVILSGFLASYEVLPPGDYLAGDIAEQAVKAVGNTLWLGVSLAAPFFLAGILINAAMGMANRMMPTLPVFFVAGPILIGFSLIILAVAMPAIVFGLLGSMGDWFATFTF